MKNGLFESADDAHLLLAGVLLAASLVFGAWLTGQWYSLRIGVSTHIGTPFMIIGELRLYDITAFFEWFTRLFATSSDARVADAIWLPVSLCGGVVAGWTVLRKPLVIGQPMIFETVHTPPVVVDEVYLSKRDPLPTATVRPKPSRPPMGTLVDPIDGVTTSRIDDGVDELSNEFAHYGDLIAGKLDRYDRSDIDWSPVHSAVTVREDDVEVIPDDAVVTLRTSDHQTVTGAIGRFTLADSLLMKTQDIVDLLPSEGADDVFDLVLDPFADNNRVTRHGFADDCAKTPRVDANLVTLFNPTLTNHNRERLVATSSVDQVDLGDFPIATTIITEAELSEVLDQSPDPMFNTFIEEES